VKDGPRRGFRSRVALAAAGAAALALLSCGPQDGEPGATAPKSGLRGVLSAPSGAPAVVTPISLGELPAAVAELELLGEEVERAVAIDDAEREAARTLDSALRRIGRFREGIAARPHDELVELSRRLAATDRSVSETDAIVAARLRRVEADTRRVEELGKRFEALADLAGKTGAPPAIRLRTGISRARLDELAARLVERRTGILLLVDKLAEARGNVAAMKAEMESRLVESRRRLSASEEEPIWNLRFPGWEAFTATAQRLARDVTRIQRWARSNLPRLLLVSVVFFGGTFLLLRRLRPGAARRAASDPAAVATLRVMESPLAAATPVTVLALVAFSPEPPLVVYDAAWLVAAPAAAWIVTRMLGPQVSRTVWVLAASLALAPFTSALTAFPVLDRLGGVLQTAPLAVVLGLDVHRGRLAGYAVGARAWALLRIVTWLLVACLGVAAAGSLLGWVGLATILRDGALGTLGGTILIVATYLVVSGLLRTFLASSPAQALRMVRSSADVVYAACRKSLRVLAVGAAAYLSIRAFELGIPLRNALDALLAARTTLGSVSISAGPILGFALVLWVSTLLARLLQFLLAEEVLPRLDLRTGTAVAISGTTRYLVLLAGFVLASGAAGIDLTTFGFLAGALGVGVGFGLQNIVSNFISGLILLFERPIQVGDAVDVAGAAGTVTQIGIRASTVRTFDGADVIVPNADLITKSVTNWTGAHPNRRFDVPVGVAYGSPLESTAQALLAAARRTPGVLPSTPPEAFLQRFGESSLDWTLRVWMKMDESPQVLSELKRAVSEELGKAKIEVPFPQRDLHIRSVAVPSPLDPRAAHE
jgi:small-conductance mechanosensitive channel